MNIHSQLTRLLTAWLQSCQAKRRLITVEKSQRNSARLILRFATPPRPLFHISIWPGRQVAPPGGSCCQQTARYRCQPDEGVPSWAVVVTLSQQRSYCNIPAIWHSSFSMALQRLNLPLNKFKILFFCKMYHIPDFSGKNLEKKKPHAKTFLLKLLLDLPHV